MLSSASARNTEMLPPRVLTVLPDYPLPATTGLHLRMVANIEAVNRLVAMGRVDGHDVLWFGTEERNSAPDSAAPDSAAPDSAAPDSAAPDSAAPDSAAPDSAAPDSALTACDSVVHAAGRVEQHTMSAIRLASSKVC
ncbi:MAG: hypothetical protein ACI8Y4_000132 [Candidatus Poriferisodalaceae bacterium]